MNGTTFSGNLHQMWYVTTAVCMVLGPSRHHFGVISGASASRYILATATRARLNGML